MSETIPSNPNRMSAWRLLEAVIRNNRPKKTNIKKQEQRVRNACVMSSKHDSQKGDAAATLFFFRPKYPLVPPCSAAFTAFALQRKVS